jgi:DNA-binding transcriptional LysR family regulator
MNELETRQLRYFTAVAEELHFGRAAERLGIAQPPLSKAIRDLERQLGVQLLTRTTRQVTLTPAGQTLLTDARAVLDATAAAARRARRAGHPEQKLRVALKADFDAGLLPPILDAYHALPVELVLGGPGDQVPALRDGRADVALGVDGRFQHVYAPLPECGRGAEFRRARDAVVQALGATGGPTWRWCLRPSTDADSTAKPS